MEANAARWLVAVATVVAVATWLVVLALLIPRLFYGAENLRVLEAVTGGRDEAYVAGSTWGIWLHGPLSLSTLYGDLYFLLGWLVLHVIALFKQPTEHTAIVVLRCISLFSYAAFGTGLYFWVRRHVGPVAAAVALLLVASLTFSDDFAFRATACQVDMLNLALTALALFLILRGVRQPSLRTQLVVGIALGAVMAVKLSAIFIALLAVAAMVVWSVSEDAGEIERSRLASRRSALGLLAVLFAGSLLVTAAVALLSSRSGSGLWRLPIPPSWPRTAGVAVYPLVLATVFVIVYLLGRPAGQDGTSRRCRSAAFAERVVLMLCVAAIAFAILCPNGVTALRFVHDLGFQSGSVQAGSDSWLGVLVGGSLPWLLPLSAVFAALLVTWSVRRPSEWFDRAGITALLVLIWEAVSLVGTMVLVGRARERWLWPLFPAFVLTADLGVMAAAHAVAEWQSHGARVSRAAVYTVLALAVLVPAVFSVASVRAGDRRDYTDLAGLPGYQVGVWLDSRLPADTSILQNAGAYIPPRFTHVATLPYGDPFKSLADTKPGVVVVNLQFKADVDALPRQATDPVLTAKAGTVQDFYAKLLSGGIGYTVVKRFAPTATSPGFVVLQADGGASSSST